MLALLIMVFSMVWILMMRQENEFASLRQMWLPFLAGTTLAFLMIGAIDLLRFKLTGTWGALSAGLVLFARCIAAGRSATLPTYERLEELWIYLLAYLRHSVSRPPRA